MMTTDNNMVHSHARMHTPTCKHSLTNTRPNKITVKYIFTQWLRLIGNCVNRNITNSKFIIRKINKLNRVCFGFFFIRVHWSTHTVWMKRQIKNGNEFQWKYGTAPAEVPPSIKVLLQLKAMFSFLLTFSSFDLWQGHCPEMHTALTRVWFQTKTFTAKL